MVKKLHDSLATLILLDRDGVLTDNRIDGVHNYSEFKMVPRIYESLKKLSSSKFKIGIITNQPNISRGTLTKKDLAHMHHDITIKAKAAGIKSSNFTIEVCTHTREDKCSCRKPKQEMINKMIRTFKLNPRKTKFYIVGDKLTDLQTLENYYTKVLRPLGVPKSRLKKILLIWRYGDPSKDRRLWTEDGAKIVPDLKLKSFASAVNAMVKMEK